MVVNLYSRYMPYLLGSSEKLGTYHFIREFYVDSFMGSRVFAHERNLAEQTLVLE